MSDYIYTGGELYHYGVKGMKWGVRRKAKKDAKEYARAKMFYGEGAGTRRKLINARVQERSKDPNYKAEFERQLSKQNMDKHVSSAKRERRVKDAVAAVGGMTAIAAAGVYVAKGMGITTKVVSDFAKERVSDVVNYTKARRNAAEWFRTAR